jgi:hypothetical protein
VPKRTAEKLCGAHTRSRPVYSLILGIKVLIVLNTAGAVKDLLDRRSNIYSSRPEMYLGQIVSGGYRVLLMVSQAILNPEPVYSATGDVDTLVPLRSDCFKM